MSEQRTERTERTPRTPRTRARRTQAERSATTRAALVAAATELFAERGYAQTGREDIAERAGVTRGALYHHFESKADVFRAVVEALDEDLAVRMTRLVSRAGRGAVPMIRQAARAYMSAAADAGVGRIMLDARSVLGAGATASINSSACSSLLRSALEQAGREGVDLPGDVGVLAAVLVAALDEAALLVAAAPADDMRRTKARVTTTIDGVLSRLLRSGLDEEDALA